MLFGFEMKLWQLASELASRLKPPGMESEPNQPWLFEIGPGEQLRALTPARNDLPALTKRLEEAGATYLLFDPYDFPESFRLSWYKLPQRTVEGLLREPLVEADFTKHQPWSDDWTVDY
jgi:hypothetical protein